MIATNKLLLQIRRYLAFIAVS